MSEVHYSGLLRQMVQDYLAHRIDRGEYLARRRSLLERIDREWNGSRDGPRTGSAIDPRHGDPADITLIPKR